jgi:hypothetical protein
MAFPASRISIRLGGWSPIKQKRRVNPKAFLRNSEPTNYQVPPGLEPALPLVSCREGRLLQTH